jgi:hypothetical protein
MNMNLMRVSMAVLILTSLDDQAKATVPASQIEHPTDREKERKRKREKKLLTEVLHKMSPFHIHMSMTVSCFALGFWQLNIMLYQTFSG